MALKRKRSSSPSSSSSSPGTTYQVFLSFRGPDTRQGFTDVLYHSLTDAGIHVFRDEEEIRKGEDIGDEILGAIRESRIFVPIFSRGYACSKWCLIELSKMFESKESSPGSNKKILPIFYDVGVNDVKLKTELYAEALQKHKKDFGEDRVKPWEEALKEVGKIKGWELKDMGHAEFAKLFARNVFTKLKAKHKYVTDCLVQRDDQVEALMNMLDTEASDVRFVGIHGMGGIGKTTLAKMVFNKLCDGYEHCSFLPNVRESTQQHKGIEHLQKKLSGDLGSTSQDIVHVDDGIMELSQSHRLKKVLIVLDDVDHRRQIRNLARDASWFGKGSRIIITTRNQEVLGGGVQTFELMEMSVEEALQVFSKHAFDRDSPPNNYLNLSKEAVESTGRLPLALEVIGSQLRETPHKKWAKTIERLKKIPHKDVQEMLMISYESLSHGAQQIFLDIACFFIDHERTIPMYMWEACEFDAKMGLKELIHKSLVKIDGNQTACGTTTIKVKKFWMHDQLRDLGRNLAKGSRIWVSEDASKVLEEEEGKVNVEMLRLYKVEDATPRPCKDEDTTEKFYYSGWAEGHTVTAEKFSGLRNLRYLQCETNFSCDLKGLLPNLRWFSWITHEYLSGTGLSFKKLVILDLSYSYITEDWTGWSQIGEGNNLKVLDLSGCSGLRKTPDLSKYSSLERLILEDCNNLVEIDPSIGKLKGLKFLNVKGCTYLKGLPEEICSLHCLEVILGDGFKPFHEASNLYFGSDGPHLLKEDYPKFKFFLPESIGNVRSLSTIVLDGFEITRLPESIGRLSGLRCLSLCQCLSLDRLPDSLADMESLVELHLSFSSIVELPQRVGRLEKLQILELKDCKYMEKLPDSIGDMKSLVKLDLTYSRIIELPETFGNLEELRAINLSASKIHKLPTSIGKLKRLEELIVNSCTSITEIPSTIKGCSNLRVLDLHYCKSLGKLPDSVGYLTSLAELHLSHTGITELPITIGNLKELKEISVSDGMIRELPDSIGMLKKLEVLNATSCVFLREIPSEIDGCASLRDLELSHCWNLKKLPDSLGDLGMLRKLDLVYSGITELPQTIGNLKELRMLSVDDTRIRRLPTTIGMLKSLQRLSLSGCALLEEIPSTMEGCTQLKVLDLRRCNNINDLPISECFLRSLSQLHLPDNLNRHYENGEDTCLGEICI